MKKYQIVWWWRKPTFKSGIYPKNAPVPVCKYYYFGVFEIRKYLI